MTITKVRPTLIFFLNFRIHTQTLTGGRYIRKRFIVVKMCVAADVVAREVRMREHLARSVERVVVSVLAPCETDFDV